MRMRAACEAMVTQIATATEWSADGAVMVGWPAPTEIKPGRVWILPGSLLTPEARSEMTSTHRTFSVDILVSVAAPDKTLSSRTLAVTDAVDALCEVLDGWRPAEDGSYFAPVVEFPDLSGGEVGDFPIPVAVGSYTVNWISLFGEGA